MKRGRLLLTALLMFARGIPATAAPAGSELTLRSAVDRALRTNLSVTSSRQRAQEQGALVSQAYSQFLPTISAVGNAQTRKDAANTANPNFAGENYNFYNVQVDFDFPLYRGGANTANLRSSRKGLLLAELDTEIQRRDLALDVVRLFYSTLHFRRDWEGLLAERKVIEELLRTARGRARIGRSQRLDVLQIESQLALLEPEIIQARNAMQSHAAELAILLGERDTRQLALRGRIPELDWQSLTREPERVSPLSTPALPELARARVLADQARDQRELALAKHLPRLDFKGFYGRTSFSKVELLDEFSGNWNFGLQLTIPLFSGLSSVQERRATAIRIEQAETEVLRLEDQSSIEEVKARQGLVTADEVIRSTEKALRAARALYAEAQKNFRLATLDALQLLISRREVLNAERALARSRYNALVAATQYFSASGKAFDLLIQNLEGETP